MGFVYLAYKENPYQLTLKIDLAKAFSMFSSCKQKWCCDDSDFKTFVLMMYEPHFQR